MRMLFIDESGTIPPKEKHTGINYFSLGGIIIPEEIWHELSFELTNIKLEFNIEGEIKWRYFAPQKTNLKFNPLSHLTAKEKESVRGSIFNLLGLFKDIRLICALIDVQLAYKSSNFCSENDLYLHAYKKISDQFQNYLKFLSSNHNKKINGIVICDHRQPKDDHQLRNLHQRMLSSTNNNVPNYQNLIEGVFLAPSHFSVGIQLADMIAGATYRNFSKGDSRFFDRIKPFFLKESEGLPVG